MVGATPGLADGISQGPQDGFIATIDASGKLVGCVVGSAGDDELLSATVDDSSGPWAAGYKGNAAGSDQHGRPRRHACEVRQRWNTQSHQKIGTSYLDVIQSISWVGGSLFSIGSTRGAFLGQDAPAVSMFSSANSSTDGEPRVGQPKMEPIKRQRPAIWSR